jgi:hypothetical protein
MYYYYIFNIIFNQIIMYTIFFFIPFSFHYNHLLIASPSSIYLQVCTYSDRNEYSFTIFFFFCAVFLVSCLQLSKVFLFVEVFFSKFNELAIIFFFFNSSFKLFSMSKSYIRLLDKANQEILRFFHRKMTENRKKPMKTRKILLITYFCFLEQCKP